MRTFDKIFSVCMLVFVAAFIHFNQPAPAPAAVPEQVTETRPEVIFNWSQLLRLGLQTRSEQGIKLETWNLPVDAKLFYFDDDMNDDFSVDAVGITSDVINFYSSGRLVAEIPADSLDNIEAEGNFKLQALLVVNFQVPDRFKKGGQKNEE